MSTEKKHNIDDLIPEGWEFREEYMEQALTCLHRQRVWMKWRKTMLWMSAASIIVLIGASLLHVCSNPTVLSASEAKLSHSNLDTSAIQSNALQSKDEPKLSNAPSAASNVHEAVEQFVDDKLSNHTDIHAHASTKMVNTSKTKSNQNSTKHHPIPSNHLDEIETDSNDQIADERHRVNETPQEDFSKKVQIPSPRYSNVLMNAQAESGKTGDETIMMRRDAFAPLQSLNTQLPIPASLRPNGNSIGLGSSHQIWAFAGNAMWADYGRPLNSLNFQPIVGIGYGYRVHPKWYLRAQLAYSSIQNPGAIFQQTQNYYDYQKWQSNTKITTNRLHYGSVQFAVNCAINKQWNAAFGLMSSIKLTGSNTILDTDIYEQVQERKETGYVSGFKRFNYGATAALDRRINQRVSLGFQYILGLTDVSDDAVFGEKTKQSNSQLNLIISYRFK